VGTWIPLQKLIASDAEAGDALGWSVGVSGDRAIVGARFDDDKGFSAGAVYVFERGAMGTWAQLQKLIASDGVAYDQFGVVVAVSGDRAIVGAVGEARATGAAYIFEHIIPPGGEFNAETVAGPDRNGDSEIDRAILVRDKLPAEFTFRITLHYENLPAALVTDLVPAQWEVVSCIPALPEDLVLVSSEGPLVDRKYRATRINWLPTGNHSNLLVTLRLHNYDKKTYEPHKTGGLPLDAGARAVDSLTLAPLLDANGSPLVTQKLCVAALQDKNHDKVINYTGNGDEDRDTLSDYYEACMLGTDPCNPDTDGDHVKDNVDRDPLNRKVK
jgi:hypothetical protein